MGDKVKVIKMTIRKGNERGHLFDLEIFKAESESELRLPVDFYKVSNLTFPHFEARIIAPFYEKGQTGKLNYHFSDKDGVYYVCYPGPINTEEKLLSVLKVWAVGQLCVMTFDRYLNEMLQEAGGVDNFLPWAEKKGFRIIGLLSENC